MPSVLKSIIFLDTSSVSSLSVSFFPIFRCKYFSLRCSFIHIGKQNTPISNKNSDLATSQ